jgi:hypothetical protein
VARILSPSPYATDGAILRLEARGQGHSLVAGPVLYFRGVARRRDERTPDLSNPRHVYLTRPHD